MKKIIKNNNMIFKLDRELNDKLRDAIKDDDFDKFVYSNVTHFRGIARIQFLVEIQVYKKMSTIH